MVIHGFFRKPASGLLALLLVGAGLATALVPPRAEAVQYGYAPEHYENRLTYGTGVYFAPYRTKIYTEPDESADPVEVLEWSPKGSSTTVFSSERQSFSHPETHFIAFFPTLEVAIMSVISDDGEGWAEVVYDQKREKTGWVKLRTVMSEEETVDWPKHLGHFQTWLDFMKYNGKAAGIYWLTGVSEYNKFLRQSPDDKAQLIQVQMIRRLKVKHIRGNWLLVEIMDFDRTTPIGWIRWRDANGRLMVFPNLADRKSPYIMGFF